VPNKLLSKSFYLCFKPYITYNNWTYLCTINVLVNEMFHLTFKVFKKSSTSIKSCILNNSRYGIYIFRIFSFSRNYSIAISYFMKYYRIFLKLFHISQILIYFCCCFFFRITILFKILYFTCSKFFFIKWTN